MSILEYALYDIVVLVEALVASLFFFITFISSVKTVILISKSNLGYTVKDIMIEFPIIASLAGGIIFGIIFLQEIISGVPVIEHYSFGALVVRPFIVLFASKTAVTQKIKERDFKKLINFKRKEGSTWTYLQ